MKKFLLALGSVLLISACSDQKEEKNPTQDTAVRAESSEQEVVLPTYDMNFEKQTYRYDIQDLETNCNKGSEIVCAVELQVKCTINPKLAICDHKKLPRFTFMEDESLRRPTTMSFQMIKIKPIDAQTIEVYTQSECNGGWFGLCQGNIIYVLNHKSGQWIVKDVYALQSI